MALQQASILSRGLSRTVLRQVRPAVRNRTWKQIGQRTYASGYGEQQSSELPWIIGSLAVTVPAAGWLLQQGPTKSDHSHDAHHGDHAEGKNKAEEDDDEKKEENEEKEEKQDDDDQKDDKATGDNKEDSEKKGEAKEEDSKGDESKQEQSDDQEEDSEKDDKNSQEKKDSKDSKDGASSDDYPPPSPGSPGQINWKPGMGKGPGEGQKGERPAWERKGEKDSQGSRSGAKHPYIDDPEKSKKGLGVTETAKIHGTVDSKHPSRGFNNSKNEEN